MKKQTFLRGVVVLFIASVIAKILGAVYRIPLTWILGTEGLGIYQLVYPLFSLIIVLSSTGMPSAIAKITAGYLRSGNFVAVRKTLWISIILLALVGGFFAILLAGLSTVLANAQGNLNLYVCYLGLTPAVVLVGILSAFRGYFQGYAYMTPTALSQIIEQGAKLIFGLLGGYLLIGYGVEYGALGALLGVSVSELVAVTFMALFFGFARKYRYYSAQNSVHNTYFEEKLGYSTSNSQLPQVKTSKIVKNLISTSIPIVLSNTILPLVLFIESIFVIQVLSFSGQDVELATRLWGINTGVVNSLINMPIVLAQAVAIAIVPFVVGEKDSERTASKYNQAISLGVAFCLPVLICFVLLGSEIIEILYLGSLTQAEVGLASKMLLFSSIIVLLGTILQIQNSMLYGLGYSKIALSNMLISATVQVGLFFGLGSTSLNIWGCVVAGMVFYFLSCVLNYIFIRVKMKLRLDISCLLPIISGIVLLSLFVGNVAMLPLSPWASISISIVGGGILYLYSLWIFGGLEKMGIKKKVNSQKMFY